MRRSRLPHPHHPIRLVSQSPPPVLSTLPSPRPSSRRARGASLRCARHHTDSPAFARAHSCRGRLSFLFPATRSLRPSGCFLPSLPLALPSSATTRATAESARAPPNTHQSISHDVVGGGQALCGRPRQGGGGEPAGPGVRVDGVRVGRARRAICRPASKASRTDQPPAEPGSERFSRRSPSPRTSAA